MITTTKLQNLLELLQQARGIAEDLATNSKGKYNGESPFADMAWKLKQEILQLIAKYNLEG